ncbi:type I 3-dehydroquinate dehydratase [Candidatus Micrarchaeota archaeon]|nr:type I 3-dehydroquinate dehydratase [Candidatus Micrarchaeota archaeon]
MLTEERFIVPVVAKTAAEAKEQSLKAEGDVVELRLDAMESVTPEELRELTALRKTLVTDRRKFEGGFKSQTDTERFDAIHAAIEAKPWAVDIEIQSPRIFRRKLIQLARDNGVKVISSYHNYNKTPPAHKLLEMLKEGLSDSDYVKIVCTPESEDDVTALLNLVRLRPGKVAAFGLGEKYAHTRILSLKLGAPFGYAKGTTSTAPGQMTVEEMKKQLAEGIKEKQGKKA